LILINLTGGMHAMTMHEGEGSALTGAAAEALDLLGRALELRRCLLGDPLARTATMAST
jgi:hypothetical protein